MLVAFLTMLSTGIFAAHVLDALRMSRKPPTSVEGMPRINTALRGPNASVKNAASNAPPVAPTKNTYTEPSADHMPRSR